MEDQPRKQWQSLCEQAAKEQDPQRLMELVREISRLLDEQAKRTQSPNAA